jgi:Uncharacterized conserved protein
MLYTRQKSLLAFLNTLGGSIASTDFQKLLFIYTQEFEEIPSYDFVPYRFGCFSFSSCSDKRRLTERGLLLNHADWKLSREGEAVARSIGVSVAVYFHEKYKDLRGKQLVAEVYRRYPYFAINSEVLEDVLPDKADRAAVERARPEPGQPGLLTIGYEGKSLEKYLNQLLQAGVTLLCDVRRNPLSRKYGFSKSTLKSACENVKIRYVHIPELGIASERRRGLDTQADYNSLFDDYVRHDLRKQRSCLERISQWITGEGHRVALTCFELVANQCHRYCVADALANKKGKNLLPVHL